MEETACIRLKCRKLETVDIDKLFCVEPLHQVVSVKGYALRFKTPVNDLPPSLMDLILSYDYLAWDGDDYADDSFTKVIPYYILKCIERKKVPHLIAFKNIDLEDALWASWHDKLFVWAEDGPSQLIPVLSDILPNKFIVHDVEINYCLVNLPSDLKNLDFTFYPSSILTHQFNKPYFENQEMLVALECLRLTRASTIISFGGGLFIQSEYVKTMDIFRDIASRNNGSNNDDSSAIDNGNGSNNDDGGHIISPSRQLTWHIYLMNRESSISSISNNTNHDLSSTIQSSNTKHQKTSLLSQIDETLSTAIPFDDRMMNKDNQIECYEEKCFWEQLPIDLQNLSYLIPNFQVVLYR